MDAISDTRDEDDELLEADDDHDEFDDGFDLEKLENMEFEGADAGEEDDEEEELGAVIEARNPLERVMPKRTPLADAIPDDAKIVVDAEKVEEFLGVPRFKKKQKEEKAEVGLVAGLAWTERGGEILSTEATLMPGKGKLSLTGQLGDVMQESGQAALSYVRSRASHLGIEKEFHQNYDIHLHVPEGAIPKDGPSAGITLATAIVSALTGVAVRPDVAMTGEITLRGKVLPIGGLKEKVLAAHRAGMTQVIIPSDNEKDLQDVPEEVLEELTIHFVETMDEVLRIALVSPPAPAAEGEEGELPVGGQQQDDIQPPLTH
jgi:ATP-dependent Lon protease